MSFPGTFIIIAFAHCLNWAMALSLALTSVATSGSGMLVLFSPARYSSPPSLANHSGEKPSVSVAKTAWQTSLSSSSGLWCGFRTSSEWPANEETGMRALDDGKRVLKTRGDQAPEVITRRAHGTVTDCQSPCESRSCRLGSYTLCPTQRHRSLRSSSRIRRRRRL